jgi:hypothetical protein
MGLILLKKRHKDVNDWIRGCTLCQKNKHVRIPKPALIESNIQEAPETKAGNKYIFVVTDLFSKYTEAFATKDQTAETAARIIVEEIMTRYGSPTEICSDRGTQFAAEICNLIYNFMDTKKLKTSAYHPQSNGQTERYNRTLQSMLRPYLTKLQDNWDEYSSSKRSPYYLMFGRNPRTSVVAMYSTIMSSIKGMTESDIMKRLI